MGFLVGIFVLFTAGWMGNWVLRWPMTIHLHLFQAGRILDCLAIVSLGRWSMCAVGAKWPLQAGCWSVVAAYILRDTLGNWTGYGVSIDTIPLLGAFAGTLAWRVRLRENGPPVTQIPRRCDYLMIAAFCVVLPVLRGRYPVWHPTLHGQPGERLMVWSRDALPDDAVVILPPVMSSSLGAFRYFARRRAIGIWKDGGEGTFNYRFQLDWERQLRDITGIDTDITVPAGPVKWHQYSGWRGQANMSFRQMPTEHFLDVATTYGATHVVRDSSADRLLLPVLYADDQYVLYRIVPLQKDN